MGKKYKLFWSSFSSYKKDFLKNLLETNEFSDVTLVSDDNHQYNVHKFILSACSSVFKKILNGNPLNTSIYLRGIYHEELESILQFIYLGETTFYHEKMDELLTVAKSLDIKEIGETIADEDMSCDKVDPLEDVKLEPKIIDETHVATDTASDEDIKDKNSILNVTMKKHHKTICKVCNKEFKNREDRDKHVEETGHYNEYSCGVCGQSFKQKIHASRHEAHKHSQEMPYKCSRNVCEKQFKNEFSWRRHQENDAIHEKYQKPYHKCVVCGKEFYKRRKWLVDQHMKSHKLQHKNESL